MRHQISPFLAILCFAFISGCSLFESKESDLSTDSMAYSTQQPSSGLQSLKSPVLENCSEKCAEKGGLKKKLCTKKCQYKQQSKLAEKPSTQEQDHSFWTRLTYAFSGIFENGDQPY